MGSDTRRKLAAVFGVAMTLVMSAPVVEAGGGKRCRNRCVQSSCYYAAPVSAEAHTFVSKHVVTLPVPAPAPIPSDPHPTLQNVYPQPVHTTIVFDNFPCAFTPEKAQLLFKDSSLNPLGLLTDDMPTYNPTTRVLTVDGNVQGFLAAGEGIADITVTVTGPGTPAVVAKKTYPQKVFLHDHAPPP